MKTWRYLFYFGVLVLALAAVWKSPAIKKSPLSLVTPDITAPVRSAAPLLSVPQDGSSAVVASRELAQDSSPREPFLKWFHDEAQKIEVRSGDVEEIELEIKKQVAQLNRADLDYLARTASSPIVPATERILASYLLGLASKEASGSLVAMATEETSHPGPHPAHSIDEAKDTQERAYKIMAVDAIYNGESEVSHKLQQLQAIVNQSKDQTIKKYAAEKIDDLQQVY